MIGIDCNITAGPCELLNPCQNQGTCANSTDNNLGYKCQCLQGFDGDNCQYDRRPCNQRHVGIMEHVMKHRMPHSNVIVKQDGQVFIAN